MVGVHKAAQGEEGPVRGGLVDEVDGPAGDPGRLVEAGVHLTGVDLGRTADVLLGSAGPVLPGLALPLHFHDFIVLGALRLQPGEVLAGLGVAGGVDHLEAVAVLRPVVLLVLLGHELGGEVHLADGGGAVAVLPEDLGETDLLVPEGDAVVPGAVVFGVAAGEDAAPEGEHTGFWMKWLSKVEPLRARLSMLGV